MNRISRLPRAWHAALVVVLIALSPLANPLPAQTIGVDTIWSAAESPHYVQGWLIVSSGATLTIEPGAEVLFRPMGTALQANIVFQNGSHLIADGTPEEPVVFSVDVPTTPTRGIWAYLKFEEGSQATIDHCDFEYGGNWGSGTLWIQSDGVTVSNSTVRESSYQGIKIEGAKASPTIANVLIEDCAATGIQIQNHPCAPVIDQLTVRRCQEAIRQASLNMSPQYGVLTFEDNVNDAVVCDIGTLTQDVTLLNTVPEYHFFGWGTISNGVTMTIEPGVTIASGPMGTALQTNLVIKGGGKLLAQGTEDHPITFTHRADPPVPGGWAYILFEPGSSGILDHADLGYAGNYDYGAVRIQSSDVTISNSVIHDGATHGITMDVEGIKPTIQNCTFLNNQKAAIRQTSFNTSPIFRNLTAEGNSPDAIVIDVGLNAPISSEVIWHDAGIPRLFYGWGDIVDGGRLICEPGSVIWFGSMGTALQGNLEVKAGGELIAVGEPLAPVIFSKRQDLPDEGPWAHLMFEVGSRGQLENCRILDGGQWGMGAVSLSSSDVSVMYCQILDSVDWGVRVYEHARPTFRFNQIVSESTTRGMANAQPTTPVNAKTCWWGDASGPYHATRNPEGLGEEVSDGIAFEPWAISISETENREATPILLDQPVHALIPHLGLNDYRLDFTSGDAPNVLVRLTPDAPGGKWTLLGLRGGFPNTALFDWEGHAKGDSLEIPIPDPETGSYYLSAYYSDFDAGTSTTVGYEMVCLSMDRYLSSVDGGRGGNVGTVTETIRGLGFESGAVVELRSSGRAVLRQFTPSAVTSSQLLVPMDLTGLAPQMTDLAVRWPDATERVLPSAFEITVGLGGKIEAQLVANPAVRPNRESVMWLEYSNTGDADMPAPYFILKNIQNTKTRLARDLPYGTDDLPILGARMEAPAGTLPPGFSGRVPIYFLPEVGDWLSYELESRDIDSSAIDWELWKDSLQPNEMDAVSWSTAWPMVKASLGNNWQTYYTRLLHVADRFAARGQNNTNVNALLEHHVLDVTDFYPVAAISGWVEDAETGLPLSGALVKAIDIDSVDAMVVATADKDGRFLLENLADGTYRLQLDTRILSDDQQVVIAGQVDVNHIVLKAAPPPEADDSVPERPADTQPRLITRGTDPVLLVWQHGPSTMARTFRDTTNWGTAIAIADNASNATGVFGSELLGEGLSGYLVAFESVDENDQRTVFWSLVRLNGQQLEATTPAAAMDATHEDLQPAVALDGNGAPVLLWLQRDGTIVDDTDVYFTLLDPSGAGAWPGDDPPPVAVDSWRDDQDCFEFTIGMGTGIPFVMQPILGKSYEFNFFGNKCNTTPSCSGFTQSISGGMNVGLGDFVTGTGTLGGAGTYGLRKNPCSFVMRKTTLSGSAALKGELDKPIPVMVWPIPYPVGTFYPNVHVGGAAQVDLIWEGFASAVPNKGSVTFSPNGGGGGAFYAAGTKESGGLVAGKANVNISGSIVYDFQKGWNFNGFCLKLIGEASFLYGHGKRQVTSSWGAGCGGKDFEPGQRTLITDKEITRISRFFRDGVPVETVVVDSIDPFTGTGNTYEGLPVLADLGTDLFDDGRPAVATTSDGDVIAVWRKMSGDYATALGGQIMTATWDGTSWSAPVALSDGVAFVEDPVIVTSSGNYATVAWAEASSAGLDENSPLADVIEAASKTRLMFTRRIPATGLWSAPVPVAPALAGSQLAPSLADWGSGFLSLTFLLQDDIGSYVYAAAYPLGGPWESPTRVSFGTHCGPPTIAKSYYGFLAVWAEDGDNNAETQGDDVLKYARSDNGRAWIAPANVPLVPVPESTTKRGTEPSESFARKSQRAIPAVPDGCCGPKCPPKCPPTPRPTPAAEPPNPYGGPFIGIIRPRDPNEKTGTEGWGGHNIVSPDQELTYTIYFENVADAAAPAQEVFVTDDLDARLDWTTLRISEVAWGDITVTPSGDGSVMNERVLISDYRADNSATWWVDIEGSVNPSTGRASFAFHTLDPETEDLPMDPYAGFLPPNNDSGRGEGHITFRIKPKAGLADDLSVRITNKAKIVFDTEKTIETNEVFHTLGDAALAEANILSVIVGLTEIIDQLVILDMNDDTVIDSADLAP